MAENVVKGKFQRTSQEQLDHYLNFIKANPHFLTKKNKRTDPNERQDYWSVLAGELNSLRGPVRTAAKWKQTLNHWKHQLYSRARKMKVHTNVTGGVPKCSERINSFEEKALEVFGTVAVDGIEAIPTIGCDVSFHDDDMESLPPTSVSPFAFEETTDQDTTPATTGTSKRESSDLSRMVDLACKRFLMEKAAEEDRQKMQLQMLKSQEMMAKALEKVGDGLAALSELVKTMVENQKK